MKIKTSDLIGPALDWAVAKCEGEKYSQVTVYDGIGSESPPHRYSSNWEQGGPILDREFITVTIGEWDVDLSPVVRQWAARSMQYEIHGASDEGWSWGPTALVAAMRCFVASKLGDEVKIPKELP